MTDTPTQPGTRAFWIGFGLVLAAQTTVSVSEPIVHGYLRYAAVALGMVDSGDWIVPRLGDAVYLLKPPLQMWLTAIPMAATGGIPGWAPHVPGMVALLGCVAFTHRLGRRLFGSSEAGWIAALVLLTSWEMLALVREKRLDPLMTAGLTGALAFFYEVVQVEAPRRTRNLRAVLCGLCLATAALTKGPIPVLFFGVIAAGFWLLSRRAEPPPIAGAALPLLAGAGAFLAAVSVWPALLVERLGFDATRGLLETAPFVTREAPWWTYAVALFTRLLPGSVLLPAVAVWIVRQRPDRTEPGVRLLLVWALSIFALLHLSTTRHHRYLLPIVPAASLLVAGLFFDAAGRRRALSEWPARLCGGALTQRSGLRALVVAAAVGVSLFDFGRAVAFAARSRTLDPAGDLAPIAAGEPARAIGRGREWAQLAVLLTTRRWVPAAPAPDGLRTWLEETGDGGAHWAVVRGEPARALSRYEGVRAGAPRTVGFMDRSLTLLPVVAAPTDGGDGNDAQ